MPFKPGQSGNIKGRPKLGETTKEKLIALLGTDRIDKMITEKFNMGDEKMVEFVLGHVYGKPIVRTENDTNVFFPDGACTLSFKISEPK
jgi:hypothetical protein